MIVGARRLWTLSIRKPSGNRSPPPNPVVWHGFYLLPGWDPELRPPRVAHHRLSETVTQIGETWHRRDVPRAGTNSIMRCLAISPTTCVAGGRGRPPRSPGRELGFLRTRYGQLPTIFCPCPITF
jgi:hypothetical protein